MVKDKDHFHGSDLEKVEQVYGIKPCDITSFAANVNPLGISYKLRTTLSERIDAITSYPDRDYTALRTSISNYIHLAKENIIVGNGSTELISLFIQITAPKKALLVTPTYSEYERELALQGGTLDYFPLSEEDGFTLHPEKLEQELKKGYDLLILCNPNNPTSTAITTDSMREILTCCKKVASQLSSEYGHKHPLNVIVDETYVEFAPEIEKVTAIPLVNEFDNLVVLRGVSKFFAAPGLRLGYASTSSKHLLKEINERKNPWTINTLAAIAGEIMFSDEEYIKNTKEFISSERTRVCNALRQNPTLKVYEPVANFVLVRILKPGMTAAMLFEACIKKGLMIRDCVTFPGLDETYFRICFMSKEKNDELLEVIEQTI